MASKFAQLDDRLSCSICTKTYDTQDHKPKILQCLHVICQSCVEKQSRGGIIRCSSCEEDTNFKPKGLLTDPSRLRMQQVDELSKPKATIPCHDCPDDAFASYFCQNCNEFYCKECRDQHLNKRNRLSRDHNVLELTSVTTDILKASQKPPKCPDHDHPLIFYCNKDGCNVPICVSCTVSEHKEAAGHNVCKLSDTYQIQKQEIQQCGEAARKQIGKIEGRINGEELKQEHLEQIKTKVLKEIDDEYHELSRLIKARRDTLIKETEKMYAEMKKESREGIQCLKVGKMKRKAALDFEECTTVHSNETEFMDVANTVYQRFVALNKDKIEKRPMVGYNIEYPDKVPDKIFKALSTTENSIRSHTVSLDSSKITTTGAVHNVRSVVAKVFLVDQQGKTEMVDVQYVKATATDLDGTNVECEVEQNRSEKCMDISLTAPTIGEHKLKINVFGQPLREGEEFPSITVEKEPGSDEEIASEELLDSFTEGATYASTSITCPQFTIDKETVHKNVFISDIGKALSWRPVQGYTHSSRQLRQYRGGRGTMCFDRNTTGRMYYQVSVSLRLFPVYDIPLYEIGLCREENIDTSTTVHQQPHSVSLTVVVCSKHKVLCFKVWKSGQTTAHNTLSGRWEFGFLLDTTARTLTIVDYNNNKVLATVSDINMEKPLWPVFAVYTPSPVSPLLNNNLILKTGTDIYSVPKCIGE